MLGSKHILNLKGTIQFPKLGVLNQHTNALLCLLMQLADEHIYCITPLFTLFHSRRKQGITF